MLGVAGGRPEAVTHVSKRHRSEDYELEEDEGAGNQMEGGAQNPIDRFKRACARCKQLKVRCDFRDDQDACDRCLKGSHECVIPGRKKRRPPPKRELLLGKIREQAGQIEKLMAQLETIQTKSARTAHVSGIITQDLAKTTLSSPSSTSGVLSSNGEHENNISYSAFSHSRSPGVDENTEWIAEARQKLEAFGTLVGLGGGNMSKSFFVESDPEDSSSNEEPEYATSVRADSDDDEPQDSFRSIPTGASPFGLMANLSVKQGRTKRSNSVSSDKSDLGVANQNFFRPSPDPEPTRLSVFNHNFPQLLKKNIITPDEAEHLFKIYFDYMNLSLSLLDPILYTAQQVYWRSPFLFTVICAIASRYYAERPDLYRTAMEFARQEAGAAFIGGEKRVEVVQAYILLSLYPMPSRRWDEDRCWIYLGQAIRMAMDMNLHHPNTAKPRNEQHAREMLNRTRAWLNCVNLDRSMGSQYGKTPIIRNTDYVAVNCPTWWSSSEYNLPNFDIHICAYNEELRMLTDFVAKVYSDPRHPTGLNKEIDLQELATEYDDKLQRLRDSWFERLAQTDLNDVQNRFRIGLLRLAYSYARLVALAYGFQHAFGKKETDENPFLARCLRAASDVISAMVDDIGIPSQRIFVRHGPEAQTVFVTFACTFLIKLLLPKYSFYIGPEQRTDIITMVQRVVDFLSSTETALDERHCLKLYARFIKGLLKSVLETPSGNASKPKSKASSMQRSLPSSPPSLSPHSAHVTPPKSHFAPLPHVPSLPFDHYAAPANTQMQYDGYSATADTNNALAMNTSEFFRAPLPYDQEFLQSMQSVTGTQGMMPPGESIAFRTRLETNRNRAGFGWMGQMPPLDYQSQASPPVR
ncbi:hypothetical protein DENSPDRAFT_901490 [Dentipellis sp. KUC8613]|nr:hypothetical protein DENSPDRAFT_901490 [Dentipellis sp. KUC8613]